MSERPWYERLADEEMTDDWVRPEDPSNFVTLHTNIDRHVTFAFSPPSEGKAKLLRIALEACGFNPHFAHEGKVEVPRKGPYAGQEFPPCGDWQVTLHEGIHQEGPPA